MIIPSFPANERERLNALNSLKIIDTDPEERFDRITRIAKKLFDVPIALVSLVEENRQWFKAQEGLDAKETPRDISFCAHAILNDGIMIVEDASQDKRFWDNPLVQGNPKIRFYLGCPLKIKKEFMVGTLCIIDAKVRQFSAADQETIRDLADMVQAELESMHLSTTDELTSLTNRRGFLLMASQAFNLCQRNQRDMTLLFFDLDKFKHINDTFGHTEGDVVLKDFAQLLLDNFRSSDVIARLGGDEFCVLCSDCSKDNMEQLLKRFNLSLKKINDSKKDYMIDYSVGYISYDKDRHNTISDMVEDADNKMYRNKRRER